MITGVAFCPQAPALVPSVGRGLDAELGPVRDACRAAIRRVATPGTPVVVVAGGDELAGFGTDAEDRTVGAWLVRDALGDDATVRFVGPDELDQVGLHGPNQVALVVVGDGSARRSEKAPGHLDERAADRDARVAGVLRGGHIEGLDHWVLFDDEDEHDDLLVAGGDAWNAVSLLAPMVEVTGAELLYEGAPFGVGYFVAVWTTRAIRA